MFSSRFRTFFSFLGMAFIGLSLIGCGGFYAFTAKETVTKSFDVPAGIKVVVETFNGEIQIQSGPDGKANIEVNKTGSGNSQSDAEADLKNVDVQMNLDGNTLKVTVRRTDSLPHGNSGGSVTITAPATASVDLATSNGTIKTTAIKGDVHAITSNGSITVENGSGKISTQTSNGTVDITADNAQVDAVTSNGRIKFSGSLSNNSQNFSTSNGEIRVSIPASATFKLDATTSNGDISSDFAVTMSGTTSKTHLAGNVGENPSTSIHANTSNGSISINKQ